MGNVDGWVIVGTKLDTKQLEKDLKQSEKMLKSYEKEAEKLTKAKAKAELDLAPYEEEVRLLKEATDEANRYAQTEEEVTKNLQQEEAVLQDIQQKYSKQLATLDEVEMKIQENTKNQELMKQQVAETTQKLKQAKGYENIANVTKQISKSMDSVVKKVGRWALAVFSVRSAYMFVRQAVSTLSQYNEQLAANLEYIRYSLAVMLQPVIEAMVSLVFTLLNYVNYLAQAWFGVNLFANASADSMNKSAKSAEKMKKSLAGFDEMNVVGGGSAGGGGGVKPSMDLSEMQGEPPGWLVWIQQNGPTLLALVMGIAGGIAAMKLATLAKNLGLIQTGLTNIQAIGIGAILAGVILLVMDIINFIKDPSWSGFVEILGDIAIVIGGIMLVMGNWWGLLVIFAGAVVKLVADNWESIKGFIMPIAEWVYTNIVLPIWAFIKAMWDTIVSYFKTYISIIGGVFTTIINLIANPFIVAKDTIVGVFNGIVKTLKGIFDVIAGIFTGDWKRVMNGFKNTFKGVFDSLWTIAKAPLNLIIGGINSLIKGANKIKFDVPDWVPSIGGKKFGFNIPTIPKLAVGGVINMPGRGVPIGGAIGGESGAEGVIPLTNSQMMSELGEAIGRYININLTNITKLDNRQIAREQKKINAMTDFAFNR